jgi:formylmethanofuran dehydrogenase subunit B
VEIALALPEVHRFKEVQTGFEEMCFYATHTDEEMIAYEYTTRGAWMRRPPANSEAAIIEVREDLATKLAPDWHIDLKRPGEATLSRLSRRVFPGEAFNVLGRHGTSS